MGETISQFAPVAEKWSQAPSFAKLTPREMQFITLMVNGLTNPQIAVEAGVKTNAVHRVLQNAYDKIRGIDGVGERITTYTNRQDIASLLIKTGFFETTKET